jgi:type II secretory pathway component PulC
MIARLASRLAVGSGPTPTRDILRSMRPRSILVLAFALGCDGGDVAATKKKIEKSAETVQDKVQEVGRQGLDTAKDGIVRAKDGVTELVTPEPELDDAKLIEQAKRSIHCKKTKGDSKTDACTIPRDVFDELLERTELMAGQAKTYKVEKGGKIVGVELQKLGPIPKAFGFRAGDVLVEANGVALDSVQGLAQLYVEMKTADTVAIAYRRGKKVRTKTIAFA